MPEIALPVADCGHTYTPPGPEGGASGYAIDAKTNKTKCYACADKDALADFLSDSEERFTAYVSSDAKFITTWTGGHLAPIIRSERVNLARWSDTHGSTILRIEARDSRGRIWKGRSNPGFYINLKRTKGT